MIRSQAGMGLFFNSFPYGRDAFLPEELSASIEMFRKIFFDIVMNLFC
jgi:hypothetical protein